MKNALLNWYLKLYHFVAYKRILAKDLPEKYIHAHLVSVLTTGVLMWSYALLAFFSISNPIPGIVGIVASIVHLMSPLLFRKNNHLFFNSNVFLAAGIIHQSTFSYFTGGFDSSILIWLGILPMLAGITSGKRGAVTWAALTSMTVLIFFLLKLEGHQAPFLISDSGQVIVQLLITFGWIFIASIVILVHLYLVEQNANKLDLSRKRNQNLVHVLSHDIATPATVIANKIKKVLRASELDNDIQVDLTKALKAADRVVEIVQNVREMSLSEVIKVEISFAPIDLNDLLSELSEIYMERLVQKGLKLSLSIDIDLPTFYSNRSLLLHQVLGNLLLNAIKFSPNDNEISLSVSKLSKKWIEFQLQDSGVGIPEELRSNLFLANYSHSSLGTNGEKGTGFGLPIVKNCMERLGGTIHFESKTVSEGKSGTCFRLQFPV